MKFKYFSQWNQLPQSSDALFSQAEKESLFFSRLWFENLSRTALENHQSLLLACVVKEDKNILAILPLIQSENKEWTSLSHIYTSLYSLFLAENKQQEIVKCLAHGLSQLAFESLKLGPIDADDNNISKLKYAMESAGFSSMRYAQFFNWFHPLRGQDFDEYMAERPSRLKNTIARKQRKLEREHGYKIQLYTGKEVAQAMPDYYAVYQASWKKKERFNSIMDGFIAHFSKQGWVRLAILYIDEQHIDEQHIDKQHTNKQPIAAQIWFVVHQKASIFKLAYNEAWKPYSPGSILTQYLMKRVIDTDKVKEIDFLTGNDRYKQDWMQQRRQRWNIVFTRKAEPEKSDRGFFERIKNKLRKKSAPLRKS